MSIFLDLRFSLLTPPNLLFDSESQVPNGGNRARATCDFDTTPASIEVGIVVRSMTRVKATIHARYSRVNCQPRSPQNRRAGPSYHTMSARLRKTHESKLGELHDPSSLTVIERFVEFPYFGEGFFFFGRETTMLLKGHF